MPPIAWHASETRTRVAALVREFESRTSAELVVTVRPASASYAAAAHVVAALGALVGLSVYLYAETEFTDDLVAPGLLLVYLAARYAAEPMSGLMRLFTPAATLEANVRRGAREAFVDQGISATRDRTGVLLYVSALERRAAIVADVGILRRDADAKLAPAFAKVTDAIAGGGSLDDLETAVRSLSLELEPLFPRKADDENELADEVVVQ